MLLGVGLFFFYTLSIGVLPEKVNKKEFLAADNKARRALSSLSFKLFEL